MFYQIVFETWLEFTLTYVFLNGLTDGYGQETVYTSHSL